MLPLQSLIFKLGEHMDEGTPPITLSLVWTNQIQQCNSINKDGLDQFGVTILIFTDSIWGHLGGLLYSLLKHLFGWPHMHCNSVG